MTDAIERLRNRARASVPPRDTSLVKQKNDELTELSHSDETQVSEETLEVPLQPQTPLPSVAPLPEPQDSSSFPEVIRRTLRIEEGVDEALELLCGKERITREVFIEAAYQVCMEDPALMQRVVELAKERYRKRKRAGERRKFMTLAKKHQTL